MADSDTTHVVALAGADIVRSSVLSGRIIDGKAGSPMGRRLLGILIVASLLAVGCASTPGTNVTGHNGEDPTLQGTQSETASTSARSGGKDVFVTAYNDDTPDGKITYTKNDRVVYPGASLLGWSYSFDRGKTWSYGGKVKPPAGIAALWGDPAIVTSGTYYSRVYISSLAIADSKLPPEGHHGFLTDGTITGACIVRSDDGGVHFQIQQCLSAGGDFYDGGAMASAGGGAFEEGAQRIFASFVDVPANRIDVWASPDGLAPFKLLPNPFPEMSMISHPRLAYDRSTGALLVAAIDKDSYIYMNRLVGSKWQTPVIASNVTSRIDVTVGGQNIRAAYGFSFDVGAASQTELDNGTIQVHDDSVRLLYTTRDAVTKRLYVRGSACDRTLPPPKCRDVPEWGTTPGNLNTPRQQWNPTVKAWPGFIGLPPEWKATYQTTDDTPGGVSIKQGNLVVLPNGKDIFIPFNLVGPRPVCPDFRYGSPGAASMGYWGDYDEMAFVGFDPSSTAPEFLLAFSDSSKGCTQQSEFTSTHLHVSSVVFK